MMEIRRPASPLMESLARNWQILLIASLPGSVLRIFAVLDTASSLVTQDPSSWIRLLQWSAEHPFITLLSFPLLTVVVALAFDPDLRDLGPGSASTPRTPDSAMASSLYALDRLSVAARELLCAASFGGVVRCERRRTGPAVVVSGPTGSKDDPLCVFHDESDPSVAQRYRVALAELERAGMLVRDLDGARLTAVGSTTARFLNRQELDRIAARARHLDESELALLRIVNDCQQRYSVDKVALYRDGMRVCAICGNGETILVAGVAPIVLTERGTADGAAKTRTFEDLVQAIPDRYLAALPGQLPRNPFLVRLTETGLRYLRHADSVHADRAAA